MSHLPVPALRTRALNSLIGAYAIQLITTGINFVSRILLARLILPEEWGLFALANVVVGAAAVLRNMGLSEHLLRETDRRYGNVLLLHIIASVVAVVLVVATSPLFSFWSPRLPGLVRLIAPMLLLTGLSNAAATYVNRELIIHKSVVAAMAAVLVNTGVALGLALSGWQVYSLVAGTMVSSFVYALLIWRPVLAETGLDLTLRYSRSLLKGSRYLLLLTVLYYSLNQVSVGIVGAVLSPLEAGYYTMVYALVMRPTALLEASLAKVVLPVMVELSGTRESLGRFYRHATVLVYAVEVPLYVFIFAYPEFVVDILLGQKWIAVVPIWRAMALYGIVNPFGTWGWEVMKVLKRDRLLVSGMAVSAVLMVGGGIVLAFRFGIYGVIAANYISHSSMFMVIAAMAREFDGEMRRLSIELLRVYGLSFGLFYLLSLVSPPGVGEAALLGLVALGLIWLTLLFVHRKLLASVVPGRKFLREFPNA